MRSRFDRGLLVAIGVTMLGSMTAGRATAQCPPGFPVDCGTGLCCPTGNTCNTVNPTLCCPPDFPVSCQNTCCPAGGQCTADGNSCVASCPPGFPVDCGTGLCCPTDSTCNPLNLTICCPSEFPVPCQNTCCPAGGQCSADGNSCVASCPPGFPVDCGTGLCCPTDTTCNPFNEQLCCPAALPVPCESTCCPAGSGCSADGASCVNLSCVLDVDGDGGATVGTDVVYIARSFFGLTPVPPSFRVGNPGIPSDTTIAAAIAAAVGALDVDGSGTVSVGTDVVYIARRLLGLAPVPPSFRVGNPTLPSDAAVGAAVDALCP